MSVLYGETSHTRPAVECSGTKLDPRAQVSACESSSHFAVLVLLCEIDDNERVAFVRCRLSVV